MKKIVISAILLAVLLGGCTNMTIHLQSNESIRDEMLEHLRQKYGREFIAISLERGHHDFLVAFPENGDADTDIVAVQRTITDGQVEMRDTFFGVIIREDIESEILTALADIVIPHKVFFPTDVYYFDNIFDSSKTYSDLRQWVSDGNVWRTTFTILISLDEIEKGEMFASKVFERISSVNLHGLVHVVVLPNEGFTEANRTNLNDVISQFFDKSKTISRSL
jgi:hypothetical protein